MALCPSKCFRKQDVTKSLSEKAIDTGYKISNTQFCETEMNDSCVFFSVCLKPTAKPTLQLWRPQSAAYFFSESKDDCEVDVSL